MLPFLFEPDIKTLVWGTENWTVSAVPGSVSIAADRGLQSDPDKGKNLQQLIEQYGADLVGEKVYARFGTFFPLLTKIIDARMDLSVQVHPGDEMAAERHQCPGKTEMWYVLQSEPGAKIYSGLAKPMTREEYPTLSGREVFSRIAAHDSKPGQLYFLPAGRIHAIGGGNILAEIQETSDITYRIYDHDRMGADGKPRQMHIKEAQDAIDYTVYPSYLSDYDHQAALAPLIECSHFRTALVHTGNKDQTFDLQTQNFVIVMVLDGECTINGLSIKGGQTLLLPAVDNTLRVKGVATLLTATM